MVTECREGLCRVVRRFWDFARRRHAGSRLQFGGCRRTAVAGARYRDGPGRRGRLRRRCTGTDLPRFKVDGPSRGRKPSQCPSQAERLRFLGRRRGGRRAGSLLGWKLLWWRPQARNVAVENAHQRRLELGGKIRRPRRRRDLALSRTPRSDCRPPCHSEMSDRRRARGAQHRTGSHWPWGDPGHATPPVRI